jgi:hypothetical protein
LQNEDFETEVKELEDKGEKAWIFAKAVKAMIVKHHWKYTKKPWTTKIKKDEK